VNLHGETVLPGLEFLRGMGTLRKGPPNVRFGSLVDVWLVRATELLDGFCR
jgi:hypothetical protein